MVHILLAAAGASSRMKGIDKIFFSIRRKPVLYWTLLNFTRISSIDTLIVIVKEKDISTVKKRLTEWGFGKKISVIAGGKTRQESVYKGVIEISNCGQDSDLVLVHDGARPLIKASNIIKVIKAINKNHAAILAVPAKDTIKLVHSKLMVDKTISRENLWIAQTPQGATLKMLKKAYQYARDNNLECTDESSLFEKANIPVKIVEGSYTNIKITSRDDLNIVKNLLTSS